MEEDYFEPCPPTTRRNSTQYTLDTGRGRARQRPSEAKEGQRPGKASLAEKTSAKSPGLARALPPLRSAVHVHGRVSRYVLLLLCCSFFCVVFLCLLSLAFCTFTQTRSVLLRTIFRCRMLSGIVTLPRHPCACARSSGGNAARFIGFLFRFYTASLSLDGNRGFRVFILPCSKNRSCSGSQGSPRSFGSSPAYLRIV